MPITDSRTYVATQYLAQEHEKFSTAYKKNSLKYIKECKH